MTEARIPARTLGKSGLKVSALGLGCMSMSFAYGTRDDVEATATLNRALDLGVNFIDTANVYGSGHNEELIGNALAARRNEYILATKFTITLDAEGKFQLNGRPDNVRACCEASLRRLKTDVIDLYYQHRVDPTVPVEDTIGTMAELVQAGKVRYLGMSEASSRSIERAVAVHPIAALQSEWSLWTRNIESDVLVTARRFGIGIVPYSPLGRGLLTGAIGGAEALKEGDIRRNMPRFQGDNLDHNLALVDAVRLIAVDKGCTPGQLALAWVLAQGHDVVPIPGTKRRKYLEENIGACDVTLTAADLKKLDALGVAAGGRYAADAPYGNSPEKNAA